MSELCGGRKLWVCFPHDWIERSPWSSLTPALFLNGSELLAPLCTRRNVAADNLGPRCHSCPQVFQGCSESLLHLSLCWQSATEASLSLQFLWAPVTPPREGKETHPVAAAPADHVEGSRSLGHKGFEPQSDKKGPDMLSQCETGEYQ